MNIISRIKKDFNVISTYQKSCYNNFSLNKTSVTLNYIDYFESITSRSNIERYWTMCSNKNKRPTIFSQKRGANAEWYEPTSFIEYAYVLGCALIQAPSRNNINKSCRVYLRNN